MNKDVSLIYVYMDSCAPCKLLAPIFEQLKEQFPTVKFEKTNAQTSQGASVVGKYAIRSVPTILVLSGETVVDTFIGAKLQDVYVDAIVKLLGETNE